MKNEWKKNDNISNMHHNYLHDQVNKVYTNIESFYKGTTKGATLKDSMKGSTMLAKVRSRKVLNRTKSREKI